jgi:PAS domain S-box-containing protein
MKIQSKKLHAASSLTTILWHAFVALSAGALLISGGLQLFSHFRTQEIAVFSNQRLIAQDAAKAVTNFVQEKFSILETSVWLTNPDKVPQGQQTQILQSLLGFQPAFRRLAWLNPQGQTLGLASRLSLEASGGLTDQLKADVLTQNPKRIRYVSPVYIDPLTSEPLVLMTVPMTNVFGDFRGTLVAEANLKFMWDLVDQIKVGEAGNVYVVDRQGNLLAFGDTARVLKGESLSALEPVSEFIHNPVSFRATGVGLYRGIKGSTVVGTYAPLGMPDWAVVTELPWVEAYREVIYHALLSVGIILAIAVLAGITGVFMARRLAVPLIGLTKTARLITGGELELKAPVSGPEEVARLAEAFNGMTAQLRLSLERQEHRYAELRRTEEALRQSEERLRVALEGTADGIWDWNLSTGQAYFSPRYYTMLGYEPGEFPPTYESWKQLLHPKDIEAAERVVQRALEEHTPFSVEFRCKTKNGKWVWILGRGKVAELDTVGKALRVAGSHSDITERKEVEEALRESERRFEVFMENLPAAAFMKGEGGQVVYANRFLRDLFGWGDAVGKYTLDLLPPEVAERMVADDRAALDRGPITVQEQLTDAQGKDRFFETRKFPILIEGGPPMLGGISVDITERKRAEEALRESAEQYRIITNTVLEGFLVSDQGGRLLDVNETYCHMLGYSRDELLKMSIRDIEAMEKQDQIDKHIQKIIETGSDRFETQLRRKDGRIIDVEVNSTFMHRTGRQLTFVRDITERKRAEEALREANLVVENSPVVLFRWKAVEGWPVELVSKNVTQFGYAPEDLLSGRVLYASIVHPEDAERVGREVQEHTHGDVQRFRQEYRLFTKDGKVRWVDDHTAMERGADGRIAHYQGIVMDITERKRAEEELAKYRDHLEELVRERTKALETAQEELVKSERLTVLGQLTAMVSHELRNPLSVIRSSAYYLQRKFEKEDEKVLKHVKRIESQVEVCDSIVSDLLEYTRGRHIQVEEGDLNALIERVLEEKFESLDVRVRKELSPALGLLAFDAEKMRRAILNILDNGIEAKRPRLQSGTETEQEYRPGFVVRTKEENGEVSIVVEDNGVGMDQATLEKAMEPLFTTKARGTGLGLAIVRKVVEEHGGSVLLESWLNQGTRVTITIPARRVTQQLGTQGVRVSGCEGFLGGMKDEGKDTSRR